MQEEPIRLERNDSEKRLIARIVAGDSVALGEAFEAHSQRVYRLAYGITRSMSDAEDVVQDVFVALPESLATFQGRSRLSTWLHRVAVRAAVMRLTERGIIDTVSIELATLTGLGRITRPLDRVALERALNEIPAAHRAVIWLRVVEGWKHSEISEVLEITENLSHAWLYRGRRLLRAALGEERYPE